MKSRQSFSRLTLEDHAYGASLLPKTTALQSTFLLILSIGKSAQIRLKFISASVIIVTSIEALKQRS